MRVGNKSGVMAVGRDIPIAPQGNARAEWTRARAVRGLAARALGGASRETRQPIIAPFYENSCQ